ncbi:SDR family oxidoreductase [Chitinophaga pinensis]|uniref:Short-chain dehydrogenase/reductase SDR n=1 Tax=Chitinophaga pinensis (strain ATCC 43595 / DSM 2588 / LMG 13176 / NBRC 15968 / NCIMB 11800 / UQM 2034) TaxID=485918 RepID=A0A979G2Y4_CHIPD|nr:SDR family NAD(P)-dependent oxidoreductase [Chitinophaga pinensis]ACU59623.1 short-chain dehydrogenase/reductase SDR [Chitinophaga pinensis DSM 2588]
MKLTGNKILITGGASGIGLGLTERFLQEGNTVIVVSRRESVLKGVSDKFPAVITKVGDLSTEAGRIALFKWVEEQHSDLNVLVNNAGVQQWTNITDADFYQRIKEEIATNVEAPVHLTALFSGLPSLNAIMNVTSGLAFAPFTKVPVYSATKAFFHSFTLSSRYLLKNKGIEVIEIIPPALNTDLGGKGLHDAAPPVSDFIAAIFAQLAEGKKELTFGFSEAMAKAGPQEVEAAFNRLNPAV